LHAIFAAATIFNVYDLMMQNVVIGADSPSVLISVHFLMRFEALRRVVSLDYIERAQVASAVSRMRALSRRRGLI
jgi:hypothetical protein